MRSCKKSVGVRSCWLRPLSCKGNCTARRAQFLWNQVYPGTCGTLSDISYGNFLKNLLKFLVKVVIVNLKFDNLLFFTNLLKFLNGELCTLL